MLVLTFISYRLLSDGFTIAEDRPGWYAWSFMGSWLAIASEETPKSRTACFVIPITFFVWMLALSIVNLLLYKDELGSFVCTQIIFNIIKWNGISFAFIPLFLLANRLSK